LERGENINASSSPFLRGIEGDLLTFYEQDIKPFIDSLDYKEQPLMVTTDKAVYSFDSDRETIIKQSGAKREELGCGKFVVKAAFKKASKTQAERIEITVELTPDYQKDYEIIPFHRDEVANREAWWVWRLILIRCFISPKSCDRLRRFWEKLLCWMRS